jgi:hypothetical protein
MMRLRGHVRLVAIVWLTCQMVAFAAAPFVLCNDHGVMSRIGDDHECTPEHHHHGHAAQPAETSTGHEHHHASETATSHSSDAMLDCQCSVSDAALAALTLESGVLTNEFVLDTKLVTAPVVIRDYAAPTRSQHIDTPPPRA